MCPFSRANFSFAKILSVSKTDLYSLSEMRKAYACLASSKSSLLEKALANIAEGGRFGGFRNIRPAPAALNPFLRFQNRLRFESWFADAGFARPHPEGSNRILCCLCPPGPLTGALSKTKAGGIFYDHIHCAGDVDSYLYNGSGYQDFYFA